MKSLRIASVPYENARPLIWGIEKLVQYLEPSRMADALWRGELDGGLVPIAEVLTHDCYEVVDGCAIACDGMVKSVLMASPSPIEKLTTVAVDPASRTSVMLLKVLLKELHGLTPQFVSLTEGEESRGGRACLLIGDRALRFLFAQEKLPPGHRLQILDLGAAWKQLTWLPFVFAVWAFRKGLLDTDTANMLRRAKADGSQHVEDFVASKPADQQELWRGYFTQNIRPNLGRREKEAIEVFRRRLLEIGEPIGRHELVFV